MYGFLYFSLDFMKNCFESVSNDNPSSDESVDSCECNLSVVGDIKIDNHKMKIARKQINAILSYYIRF